MEETEASGGFKISANGTSGVHGTTKAKDEFIYVLVGKRARFKDRMNKKVWTLALSGRNTVNDASSIIYLTDDSSTQPAIATPGGLRHNIVSGALGAVTHAYTSKCYGWFFPECGTMVFSGNMLKSAFAGHTGSGHNDNAGQLPFHGSWTSPASMKR